MVLECARSEVSRARKFVLNTLTEWGHEAIADDAVLLVSELVTNAILHAGTEVVVTLRQADHNLRIEVTDRSTEMPHFRAYGVAAATGRGLHLVDQLAESWGVEVLPEGKTVWSTFTDREAG